MYATFSSPKKKSGSHLVTHAKDHLITLILSRFIDKSLSVQNDFKAFRCLYGPSKEMQIKIMSLEYSNIGMVTPFYVSGYLIYIIVEGWVIVSKYPCFTSIVLAMASKNPLGVCTFPYIYSYSA